MRFVIDTSLLVSGIISSGLPRQLFEAARARGLELSVAGRVAACNDGGGSS
jgi:predicted nucleic acid-binding protein